MNQGFLSGDSTGFHEFLNERVVGGHLLEHASAESIHARIPDVGNDNLIVVAQQRTHGCPHAGQIGVLANRVDEFGGASRHGVDEALASDLDGVEPFVCDGGDGLRRERARDVTTRVTTHPIGDEKQVCSRVARILIARTNAPDVAARDREDPRVHLWPQFEDGRTDRHGDIERDWRGYAHALVVHESSVGGTEVLDDPVPVPQLKARVVGGGVLVSDHESRLGTSTDGQLVGIQRDFETFAGPGGNDQFLGGARRRCGGDGRQERRRLGPGIVGDVALSLVAASQIVSEQIAPKCENDREDENPQQGEESETENKERQFTHADTPGRIRKISWVPPI